MGGYYRPQGAAGAWSAAAARDCGFDFVTAEQLKARLLFAPTPDGRPNTTHTICGDSTALGEFRYNLVQVVKKDEGVLAKLEWNPKQFSRELIVRDPPPARKTTFKFSRLFYVSTAAVIVCEAIATSGAGDTIVVVLGNWDMNWKVAHRKSARKIPGWEGPLTLASAAAYWAAHVTKFLAAVDEALQRLPLERRPFIVIREMFLPYCNASRFTNPGRGYRQCPTVLRPVLAPMYRRVLSAMAWSMRVPVVRVDHLFRDDGRHCALPDGIHLTKACSVHEDQLVWNALLLLRRARAVQGLRRGDAFPNASHFVDAAYYGKWLRAFAARRYNASGAALADGIPTDGLQGGAALKPAAVAADEAPAVKAIAGKHTASVSLTLPDDSGRGKKGSAGGSNPAASPAGAGGAPGGPRGSEDAAARFRRWHGGLHPLVLPCLGAGVAFALVWVVTKP
jgi:hypothetical protein